MIRFDQAAGADLPSPANGERPRLWWSSLCLASFTAACGAARVPRSPVLQLDLHGVRQVDRDDLADGLAHHAPEGWPVRRFAAYDPLQLTIDRQRVLSFYRSRGFYSARLEDVQVRATEGGYAIALTIDEGPAFTIRSIHVTGPTGASSLRRLLPFDEGDVFLYDRYEEAKATLAARLVGEGYAYARVEGRVEVYRRDAGIDVTLIVDPGPKVRFGEIRIDPGPLPESAIRARLAFETGDVYSPAALARTEARLYELGLVGGVTFSLPNAPESDVMDVGIRIRPGPRNELRLGAGLGRQTPNYQMRFRTGYVRRHFFDPRVRLSTELRPAVVYRPAQERFAYGIELSVGLTREDFLVPRLVGQAQVQYNLLQYEAYATRGPAFRLIADRPWLDDRLHVSVGAHLKLLGFARVDPVIPRASFTDVGLPRCGAECDDRGTPGGLSLLYLEPALTFDGRDDPVDPRRGVYARVHLELGRTLNGPGLGWIRLTPETRGYLSLGTPRLVLAGRARLGAKLMPGAPLPATQRYFGGGSESQRGFTIRQLSPFFGTGPLAVPVGGQALFELSTELRAHLFKVFGMRLGLVGFVDAADVGQDLEDVDWLEPHLATGGGLRLFTPIGPVRFDVGYRLNRVAPGVEPGGPDRLAFHLSLGEAF